MKKTYKFELPQSKEVEKTNIRVEDGKVFVNVEFKEKFEPKDGDFIFCKGCDSHAVFVCKRVAKENTLGCFCGIQYFGDNTKIFSNYGSDNYTHIYGNRFATKDEVKKFLTDIEKEYHKRWNAEKKCLEDIYVPKFGDIVRIEFSDIYAYKRNYVISIFPNKEIPSESEVDFFDIAVVDMDGGIHIEDAQTPYYNYNHVYPASESEKKELFDKLAKAGKRWNPETKELEDIRWMPNLNEKYYFIDSRLHIAFAYYTSSFSEKDMINIGNCFRAPEAAQKVADQIKEIFINSKAE